MYLLDTNVISEFRKKSDINRGVRDFKKKCQREKSEVYLSSLTIGELLAGVVKVRNRNDFEQAEALNDWLEQTVKKQHGNSLLQIDDDTIHIWAHILGNIGKNHEIDKLLAAQAIQYGLTLVTRNIKHVKGSGAKLLNPFAGADQKSR